MAYIEKNLPTEELTRTTGVVITEFAVKEDIMVVEEPAITAECVIGKSALVEEDASAQVADTAATSPVVDLESMIVRGIEPEEETPDSAALNCLEDVRIGQVAVTVAATGNEQLKRNLTDWLPLSRAIHVYPNPVSGGGTVKVSVNIGQSGSYKLELLDASGRQVYVQALQVVQPSQVLTLATQSSWSHGVYWIRITGLKNKKLYQSKLVIQ